MSTSQIQTDQTKQEGMNAAKTKDYHCESEEEEEMDTERLYYQRYPSDKGKKTKTPPYAAFIKSQKEYQTKSQLLESAKNNVVDLVYKIEQTVLSTYYLSRVQQQQSNQNKQTNKENKKKQTKQDDRSPQEAELYTAFKTLDKLRQQAATQEEELILLEIRTASLEFEFNLKKQIAEKYALKHGQDFAAQVEQSRLELEQKSSKFIAKTAADLLAKLKQPTNEIPKKEAPKVCLTLAEAERLFEQDKALAIQV